jgi:hypothetical protein
VVGRSVSFALFLASIALSLFLDPQHHHANASSFVIEVGADEDECFVIRTPSKGKAIISGNYDLLDDDLSSAPLRVVLTSEGNRKQSMVWESEEGSPEGTFSLEVDGGRYSFCIHNGAAGGDDMMADDGEARHVGFAIRVTPLQVGDGLGDNMSGAESLKTAELLAGGAKLIEGLDNLADHQAYLRNREVQHRNLVEATFARVVNWTMLEAVLLVGISVTQVMYLKKFLERRSYL